MLGKQNSKFDLLSQRRPNISPFVASARLLSPGAASCCPWWDWDDEDLSVYFWKRLSRGGFRCVVDVVHPGLLVSHVDVNKLGLVHIVKEKRCLV